MTGPETIPTAAPSRGKPLAKIVLEVVLISAGVFFGLAGQQWKENVEHRDQAKASLHRFRSEVETNRAAVARVKDYHVTMLSGVRAYLAKDHKTRNVADVQMKGLQWVSFEHTAWDLALATQSLAYLDSDLAVALSRIYNAQQSYTDLTRGMTQAMYLLSPRENFDGLAGAAEVFFGDLVVMEPAMLVMYDKLLPQIDRALGGPRAEASPSK